MKKLNAAILAIILFFTLAPVTEASVIDEMKYYVKNYYYEPIPPKLDAMTTTKQISDALDPYSHYMTKDEFEIYKLLLGIGGSAATEYPLQSGEPTGKPSVSSQMLYGNTGYILVKSFSENLGELLEQHWSALQKNGARTLIIDLRNNGGGYVDSAQKMLGFFDGITSSFYLNTRQGKNSMPAIQGKTKFPKNTYILMNRNSASASEMVAVSAKDQNVATIIGQQSYGKGTVQSFFKLTDQGVLKLTTGEFVGAAGTKVNKIGVTPHYKTARDKELQTAHRLSVQKPLKLMGPINIQDINQTITFNLPYKMNFLGPEASHQIELIQLGANKLPITITQTNFDSLVITPKLILDTNNEYAAVIRPKIQRVNGKRVNSGFYTSITVGPSTKETQSN